jgi:hypothetical protein
MTFLQALLIDARGLIMGGEARLVTFVTRFIQLGMSNGQQDDIDTESRYHKT